MNEYAYPPASALKKLADNLRLSWWSEPTYPPACQLCFELTLTVDVARDGETVLDATVGYGLRVPPHALYDCLFELARLSPHT